MHGPRVFTIPSGTPFLPTLAESLLDGSLTGGWPDGAELADATIYLPTRRAVRAFGRILVERSPRRALALPRIVPLGDAEAVTDAPEPSPDGAAPVSLLERRLILAGLIQSWSTDGASVVANPADALALADDLAALMDSLAVENVAWDALAELVEAEFSAYFAGTLAFVRIAHEAWPRLLAERGVGDPARCRHEVLLAEAERLASERPAGPVVAAGSTGSIPATARLLGSIARLPHGAVVLPGLDLDLDEAAWAAIGGAKGPGSEAGPVWGHAQLMLHRLLAGPLGVPRSDVVALGPVAPPDGPVACRRRFVSEALRPAETTDRWAAIPPLERRAAALAGGDGLYLVEAADEREEAIAIAIALRETLARPGRTAALVTPDRALARRVAAELARWDVAVADSAGTPLSDTPAGRLARLAADAAAARFAPVPLLALLAHPGVTLGLARSAVERAAAALEIGALRGTAPAPGLAGIAAALAMRRGSRTRRDPLPRQNLAEHDWDAAADLVRRLERAFARFAGAARAPQHDAGVDAASFLEIARPHARTVEELTAGADEDPGADRAALDSLFDELALLPPSAELRGRFGDYPAFFASLARERALAPPPRAGSARVEILGLLEARLLRVDRAVLGGLDEGLWPPTATTDPFLNRPMRLALGLSPPERRIGQTAHDFAQALGAPEVVLTRARKRDGKPTVPSRFLERMRAFAGDPVWRGLGRKGGRFLALAAALDAPRRVAPLRRPAPRPGPKRFPRSLSVTEVETLIRDPYAIYARHVLRLTPLDPTGALPNLAERGSIVHDVLAAFATDHPGPLPADAAGDLRRRGRAAFEPIRSAFPDLHALWWPAFERMIDPFLDWEAVRRERFASRHVERHGRIEIPLAGGALTVRGIADRIEIDRNGSAAIIDFKTGTAPTAKQVAAGFSPQLTLEAAMLLGAGFEGVPVPDAAPALHYVKLGGRERLRDIAIDFAKEGRSMAETVEAHLAGLAGLARRYGEEGAGYLSRPFPQFASRYSPYDHLARVREWSITEAPDADAP